MPHLTVRDIDIFFDRAGAGAPLLAISGSRGDLRRKPNLLESPLTKSFDVLAYDQRGLGRTSKPNKAYSIADYADDAAALLDAVGWERVRVVGVSFGGMVALELVLRHPDRVSKLALCCTSPGGEGGSSYPLHTLQNLPADERARVMMSISDTRRDAGWAAGNPRKLEELIGNFTDDPFAGEPGHQSGISRLLEARRQHDNLGAPGPHRVPSSHMWRKVRWDRPTVITGAYGGKNRRGDLMHVRRWPSISLAG